MIDGKNVFVQAINSELLEKLENIRKIAIGKGDDYTADCLLDYSYFKESYKIFAVDLSKPQALDADPRAIQQINFTVNLDRAGNTTMFFIIKEAKETMLDFSIGTAKVLLNAIPLSATSLSTVSLNAISMSDLFFMNIK